MEKRELKMKSSMGEKKEFVVTHGFPSCIIERKAS